MVVKVWQPELHIWFPVNISDSNYRKECSREDMLTLVVTSLCIIVKSDSESKQDCTPSNPYGKVKSHD